MTAGAACDKGTIVAVGMFDGMHTGHQFVLQHLKDKAQELGLTPVVVTFANHPLSLIRPDNVPGQLMPTDTKIEMIKAEGIENITVLEFDERLRNLTARRFAERILVPSLNARALVLGYDNTFGSDRLAGADEYREALAPCGIEVYECAKKKGRDISSSLIRAAVREGRLDDAAEMLGRPYTIGGTVKQGRQLGRTIGFPTANIDTEKRLLPLPGVYAARVARCDEPTVAGLPAMLNIGTAPTVTDGGTITAEAHIISDKPVGELYGKHIELELLGRLRDEKQFESLDVLKMALEEDRRAVLTMVARHEGA